MSDRLCFFLRRDSELLGNDGRDVEQGKERPCCLAERTWRYRHLKPRPPRYLPLPYVRGMMKQRLDMIAILGRFRQGSWASSVII